MKLLSFGHLLGPLILLIVCAHQSSLAGAQFLFSYEINQEDDSRAPKSSLFDPSSFKIVTPSQLQSSYQKISSQLDSTAAAVSSRQLQYQAANEAQQSPVVTPEAISNSLAEQQALPEVEPKQPVSLLKQTSAALQSFADLFSLAPSSSPTPLGATNGAHLQQVDQQAEARSLHEHWTQQQQRAHQQPHQQQLASLHQLQQQQQQQQSPNQLTNSALNSFTTSPTGGQQHSLLNHQHQQQQQQQQQQPNSYQPQQSQASYWLTASPLKSPDGNFLVQIKQPQRDSQQQQLPQQPQQQQQQHQLHHAIQAPLQHHQTSSLVDNLLAIGHRATGGNQAAIMRGQLANQKPLSSVVPSSNLSNLAQSSFLSTPTSYYPAPSHSRAPPAEPPVAPAPQPQPQLAPRPANHHTQSVTSGASSSSFFSPAVGSPSAAPTDRSQGSFLHTTIPSITMKQRDFSTETAVLRPPANLPENFSPSNAAIVGLPVHKSAEETLISYRQQQQHDQQQASYSAQQQQQQHQQQQQQQQHRRQVPSDNLEATSGGERDQQETKFSSSQNSLQQQQQQQQASSQHRSTSNDIPKVSPQIYESFLLQQKDQHEKHMELLKQQQELNKLMEQKQKQQKNEEELKRKRKKEELDKEARKKALREQEQSRKLKLEQEEREMRRRREEEERKRAEETLRYREMMEAREREAKLRRQVEEERALKQRLEREQREEQEAAERKRQAEEEAAAAEQKRKQDREAEEARQQRKYLGQQEELRKLLELKQKEDEAQLARRRQAMQQQQQHQSSSSSSSGRSSLQTARVNRIVAELRERTGTQGWGTPLRTRGPTTEAPAQQLATGPIQTASSLITTTSTSTTTTSTTASPPANEQHGSQAAPAYGRSRASYDRESSPATTERVTRLRNGGRERVVIKKQRMVGGLNRNGSGTGSGSGGSSSKESGGGGNNQTVYDEKLIRQNIPLYSGPGKYGLYRGGNDSVISSDLAALLDSVSLPPSTSTTSTTTTPSPSPATPDESDLSSSRHRGETSGSNGGDYYSSSLSPLLQRDPAPSERPAHLASSFDNEPIFDDDVPRRPARGITRTASQQQQQPPVASGSMQHQTLSHRRGDMLVVGRFSNESTSGSAGVASSSQPSAASSRTAHIGLASLPADSDNDGIPGRAGVEYPVLSSVPPTSFSCSKQPLNGYYADTETACQVVHLCQGGAQSSILCPNGTIFNQEKFSCQWWYEVNCSRAPNYYQLNDNLYKSSLPAADGQARQDDEKDSSSSSKRRNGDKPEVGGRTFSRKEKLPAKANQLASSS